MPNMEVAQSTLKEPEKELFSWVAPARPFKKRNREFYITLLAIAAVVGIVLFLVEGFMPVLLIISLIFLFYIMNTVPPENVEYKITNKGINVAGNKTDWSLINRYWFARRFDSELLVMETQSLPGRLEIVIEPNDKEKIQKELSAFIIEEKVSPSYLDKATDWFAGKLPGNR